MNSNPPEQPNEKTPEEPASLPSTVEQPEEIAEVERLAEMLPPEQRRQLIQVVRASMSHRGPLPTPDFLARYDQILPGLAERIVRLPEKEQDHRHNFADTWLRREARLRDRGQIFGMAAMVIVLAFCAFLVLYGDTKTAGVVAVSLVAAVVGIFVTGKVADVKSASKDDD